MTSTTPNNLNHNDIRRHAHVIDQLSKEVDRPVKEIEPLYEDILTQLRAKATIHDYLAILVSKRVKYILKH
ncbi:MAG: DUF3562 domain-containing protein [Burkholderiaceae bacterium]